MSRWFFLLLCTLHIVCGCNQSPNTVEVPFAVQYAGKPVSCRSPAAGISLTDLRFFVYDAYLLDVDGNRTPITLIPDGKWQTRELAFLDLEDGQGSCSNGTAPTNSILRGAVTGAGFVGLGFVVGVPQHLNHGDPLQAKAPLTNTPMHWHWRSGYKFLRAGVKTDTDGFWIHVGSSRCEGTIGNLKGCRSSNRATIELPDFVPGRDLVALDLGKLLSLTNLDNGEATDCSSGPDETECSGPFKMLGIEFDSGRSHGPAAAIRAVPKP